MMHMMCSTVHLQQTDKFYICSYYTWFYTTWSHLLLLLLIQLLVTIWHSLHLGLRSTCGVHHHCMWTYNIIPHLFFLPSPFLSTCPSTGQHWVYHHGSNWHVLPFQEGGEIWDGCSITPPPPPLSPLLLLQHHCTSGWEGGFLEGGWKGGRVGGRERGKERGRERRKEKKGEGGRERELRRKGGCRIRRQDLLRVSPHQLSCWPFQEFIYTRS